MLFHAASKVDRVFFSSVFFFFFAGGGGFNKTQMLDFVVHVPCVITVVSGIGQKWASLDSKCSVFC